jgi:aspartyl-tRNA(Asn)/glutamyl-tRNA(Gln) amidotransferase subunit A
MTQPRDLELVEMLDRVKKKELSSAEIVESCLDGVAQHEKVLNAFISLDREKVLEQSRRIDAAKRPDNDRFLFGVPVGVKDLIDVQDEVTTNGSSFFKNATAAKIDADVIRALKEDGAVIFGKTNLHEFAWGATTENPHFGSCRNPWNPDHNPGGSSGGSGAAVASRMVPAALGTDTLGSIRIPSSFCGIVGLKPTYGLISTEGIFPLGYTYDHVGPMTRTVADAKQLFSAMAGSKSRDRLIEKAASTVFSPTESKRLKGMKIAVLPELVPEEACHKTVFAQYQRAFEIARDEGAQIVEERIPGFESALFAGYTMTLAQAAEIHHERLSSNPDGFGDDVRELLETGHMITAVDYVRAQRMRAKLLAAAKELMERVDAWIWPTTPIPAPRIGGSTDANTAMFTGPVNVIGFPSLVLPSGLTEDRLPVSVQIIAEPFSEYRLFEIGQVLEEKFHFTTELPDGVKHHQA